MFAAIYHPVGIAMLVSNQPNLGRTLGVNGVWGNAGLAFAALLTGALADLAGWRAAFFVPGALCIAAGFGFVWAARGIALGKGAVKKPRRASRARCSRGCSWSSPWRPPAAA